MKKLHLLIAASLVAASASAQTLNVTNGSVTYSFLASQAGDMTYSGTSSLTILDKEFDLAKVSKIYVDETPVTDNTVTIVYNESSATVNIAGNIAKYVTAEVTGANVSIYQSEEVGDDTCGEITYSVSGTSSNGSLYMEGDYKAGLDLRGLTLTNPSGAAIDIQNGKRIEISAKNGTVNTLTDGAGGKQKGALVCKGHLEFKGKGTLTISGNSSHAIYAKEYVEIKNLTLNILSAGKDGINCSQYFLMESGTVNISGTGDDGIQTSYKDDTDREAEDTGCATIKGGKLTITITADAAKGIKADADVIVNGGEINITSNSNGTWDSSKLKTKASACIGADGDVNVTDGTLILTATGGGGKGISCDGTFTTSGGDFTIATTGGMLAYVNKTLNQNYTGNSDNLNSDYKSSAKGIKADTEIIINGGKFHITTATNNAEGIESKGKLTINDGTIFVKAYDDGMNSSSDLVINGGDLTIISIVGDGIDSNANLTIAGGVVRTFGSGGAEMGLDASTETGCAVYFTGGTIFAFGGSTGCPTKSGSTQAFVTASGSIKAGTEVSLSSGSTTLATFTIPEEYNSSTSKSPKLGPGNGWNNGGWGNGGNTSGNGAILISCPALSNGSSYTLSNNGSTSSVTAKTTNSSSRPF
jgi:hypothetical protein